MNKKSISIVISIILAVLLVIPVAVAFTAHAGDTFSYTETTSLGNGTGDYEGYTEQATYHGTETVTGTADNTVSAHYGYSYSWSNSSGSTETGNPSGDFTFSAINFLYINGTDDQQGYVNPTVWFAMDNSLPEDAKFTLLNTEMTVMSKNFDYFLPSQNKYVSVIWTQGGSSYQRNDVYGQFNAQYTWTAYFDPSTGYIVAYNYEEQDTSPSAGFSYSENLYVTTTSYQLTAGATSGPTIAPATIFITPGVSSFQFLPIIIVFALALVVVVALAIIYAMTKASRKTLPRHPYEQPYQPPPPPSAPPQNIDLTPKQPTVQQVVIKEVVKVKCRYCGALIDSTAQNCPICGAPRT